MEQIIINKKDGSPLYIPNYAQQVSVTTAEQLKELNGQDILNITVVSAQMLTFDIGDCIDFFDERYTINTIPEVIKHHDRSFEYPLKFEGIQYELIKAQYVDIDENDFSTGTSFFLMGDLEDFLKLLIRNINRIYPGVFSLGDFPLDTTTQNLTFSNETCLAVLQRLCEVYEYEYHIERIGNLDYQLHIQNIETILPDTFRYGQAKGLYTLRKNGFEDTNVITRVYAFGSTRNILPNYRGGSPRLKLPLYVIPSEGMPYIENPTAITEFGIVEASISFDDIYPHRSGKVTGIDANDPLLFLDTTLPFDLEAQDNQGNTLYLMNGMSATVSFTSGNLAGYEFTIVGYDHITRTFEINTYTDENNRVFPSATEAAFKIQAGDEYVLLNINMPQSYIDTAEQALYDKALDYLGKNSIKRMQWNLEVDHQYVKQKVGLSQTQPYFKLGYWLSVVDEDLQINTQSKIQTIKRDLINHHQYTLTLGEEKKNNQLKKKLNKMLIFSGLTESTVTNTHYAVSNNAANLQAINTTQQLINQNNTTNTAAWIHVEW